MYQLAITEGVGKKSICYTYYDKYMNRICVTNVPKNDDQAVDYFSTVANTGSAFKPVYLERDGYVLPYSYSKTDNTVWIHMPDDPLFVYEYETTVPLTQPSLTASTLPDLSDLL